MLIDLGKEALESIVKDGVKEMMGHIDNSNRNANKRSWFIGV